jgi:hypothetical protein
MLGVAKKIVGFAGVALLASMTLVPTSGAETNGQWLVDGYGHPVEPYIEIPGEFRAASPATQAGIEGGAPLRCQSIAFFYDGGIGDSVGQILTYDQYNNPTKAWAINPPTARPVKDEKTSYPGGPKATADCPSVYSSVADSTLGPVVSQGLSFEGGSSRTTTNKSADEDLIVSESINRVTGVKVGDLSIASVLAWLKVEFRPSVEPKVSYRIELGGINDGKSFSGANYEGLVLAGQGIAGGDLAKQFNEQSKANRGALKTLGQYGFSIFAPRAGYSAAGRYILEISALDGSFSPAARQGTIGQTMGIRLGVARVGGRYEANGEPAPHDKYPYLPDPAAGVS